jgi:hypothetical protein
MKRSAIVLFCVLSLLAFTTSIHAQPATPPDQPKPQVAPAAGPQVEPKPATQTAVPKPEGPQAAVAEPEEEIEAELEEVFFSAGTLSPDGQSLYVLLDQFLFQYAVPGLELKKKVDLGIAPAPATPTLCMSKDGRQLFVIHNDKILQINMETMKVEQEKKIAP